MDTIRDRILQYIDYKGLSRREFCRSIGVSPTFLAKDAEIGSQKIVNIISTYSDININWLIMGRGEMVINLAPEHINRLASAHMASMIDVTQKLSKRESQPIPVYDLQTANENLAMIFDNQPAPVEYISLPNLPNIDGAVYMRGDSMYPEIKGGDIVLYKKINRLRNSSNIFFGQMYLLSFSINDDHHVVVKYIHQSQDEKNVTLVSTNHNYPPLEIPIETISALAIIKASVRYNTIV